MTTKNTVFVVGNNGNATLIQPPVNRKINPDCTACCPPVVCNSPDDDFCIGLHDFTLGNTFPGTGSASPLKLYVDSAGWVDDNCDCSNLNGTFPCALNATGDEDIGVISRPMEWQYLDSFATFRIAAPLVSTTITGFPPPSNPVPWVLAITSPNINGFTAIYHCDGNAFSGCGSAVFQYFGTNGLDGNPGSLNCLSFPQQVVVRSPPDDTCNCVCNTMSFPPPNVLYLNLTTPGAGLGGNAINVRLFKMPGQQFAWYAQIEFEGTPFPNLYYIVVCCNGKLAYATYNEGASSPTVLLSGSGCFYTGTSTDIFGNISTYTITCDPI